MTLTVFPQRFARGERVQASRRVAWVLAAPAILAAVACQAEPPPVDDDLTSARREESAVELEAPSEEEPVASTSPAPQAKTTLLVESWRIVDEDVWNDKILPVFEDANPHIDVSFVATLPVDYDAQVLARLERGIAGDVIACRPFDRSLQLFEEGHLADLTGFDALDAYPSNVKKVWSTDDGTSTFCLPAASVIHGFIYNQEIFDALELDPPRTTVEFFAVLEEISQQGDYVPLAIGASKKWELATMGFQNIGPTYWRGEQGRLGLVEGTERLTDPAYVAAFEALSRWNKYLPVGFESMDTTDSRLLFTSGNAAIYPAGSWEIHEFNATAGFQLGAFRPPSLGADGACFVTNHTDMGFGISSRTPNREAAEVFVDWLASGEFASLYSNALPGFFSLREEAVALSDPLAAEMGSWAQQCETTIRNTSQFLSRGEPSLELQLWDVSVAVASGRMTPTEAADLLQTSLESWYRPQQESVTDSG